MLNNNFFRSLMLLSAIALLFTLFGNLPVQAQIVNPGLQLESYSFEFLSPPKLGETVEVIFTATAKNNSAQVVLENTSPLTISPLVYGVWSGVQGTGGISQKTTLSFTSAGTHTISGSLKIQFNGQTDYAPINFQFNVLPEYNPVWLINTSSCAEQAAAELPYFCVVTVRVGLVATIPYSQVFFKGYLNGTETSSFLFPFDDVRPDGTIDLVVLGGWPKVGSNTVRFAIVQTRPDNDGLVLSSNSISVKGIPQYTASLPLVVR